MMNPNKSQQQRDREYLDLYAYAIAMTIICIVLFCVILGVASERKEFTRQLGNMNESGVVCSRKTMW